MRCCRSGLRVLLQWMNHSIVDNGRRINLVGPYKHTIKMGWKSTITITREKAIQAIMSRILTADDREISDALESLGFGDNPDLSYYGHNFMIGTQDEADEDSRRFNI